MDGTDDNIHDPRDPSENRYLTSGWEEDLQDIEEEADPHSSPEKEILWAAEYNNFTKLKELLAAQPSLINCRDRDGYTPLHRACTGNHKQIVDYLLAQGADLASQTELLWQPLHSCCQWNNSEIAATLIQNGADINALSEGMQTPLHIAASHGANYNTVQLLLIQPYVKPHLYNKSGETALDIAQRSSKFYNLFDMADPLIAPIVL